MKSVVIGVCPVCSNDLHVEKLRCDYCKTGIEGQFELDKFSYLTDEERYFAEIFIKNRGNIKEIEKELGISYPTVRRNLDNVIKALGYSVDEDAKKDAKMEVLRKLDEGEITAAEAIKLMKG